MYNSPIKNNKLIQEAFEKGYQQGMNEQGVPSLARPVTNPNTWGTSAPSGLGGPGSGGPRSAGGGGQQSAGGAVSAEVVPITPINPVPHNGKDAIPGEGDDGYVGGGTHKWPGGSCPYRDILECGGNGKCRIVRYYYWRGVQFGTNKGTTKWRRRAPYGDHPA
tara:strand:- start:87 stop:575 length:489 start_codon:yes stop_codon:yes gene_type:complete